MTTSSPQVRRATVDDLPKLVDLWKQENLAYQEFEKRFKEIQVVEGPGGQILGALGLQLAGLEGKLHSEVFAHMEQSDALREKLWGRVQILARNHGLVRIWTQLDSPFWHSNGFNAPLGDVLSKLPSAWAEDQHPWRCLQLREEPGLATSIDKEFAVFQEAERERTQLLFQKARVLKMVAGLVAVGVFVLVLIWAFLFFRLKSRPPIP